jgi:hypothetical protein
MKSIYLIPVILLLWYNQSWSQCPANITISGVYATTYTNSNNWITSTGITTIPSTANVTLDANPTNDGYVLLDVGFVTEPNSVFLATVETPCTLLGTITNESMLGLKIFPNPVNNILNIKSDSNIDEIQIFDLNGRLIFNENYNSENIIVNTEQLSAGMFLIRIKTQNGISNEKFMKK